MSFLTFNYTWAWALILIIALIMIAVQSKGSPFMSKLGILPNDAIKLCNQEGALLLDIRKEEAFKSVAIATSKHLDVSNLETQLKKFNAKKPIILVDAFDREAFKVAKTIEKLDPNRPVYVLQGGISAWQKANLPLKRG
ncbi:rhodanese-like domain-containing protein [Basilea psittacipulmonis]|uniref:rhodanese-like domain-containing protein n=1 Tax=Basilea psittacipulmonis TaxID=1472345 RepID=UPI00056F9092|nr:rhodanese-like domain-containing protein [Basilea psittacipulmonis]